MNHSVASFLTLIFPVPAFRSFKGLQGTVAAAIALLLADGRFFAASAEDAPLPETRGELVLFDFGDENDKDIRDAAIARFYTHYPNVKVTDRFTPNSSWADYYDKLAEQIASGNAPDLIHIATEGMQLAIQRNLIIPLDTYAKSEISAKDLLNDIDPVLLKGFTVNGKLYLVPIAWNNMMIYYNTKVFREAGIAPPADSWTWDDFLVIAKRLTSCDGPERKFGFGIPYFNFGLVPFWYANSASVLKENLMGSNLSDPNFLESVKFIHGLIHEQNVSPDPVHTDPRTVFQQFAAGKIAMIGGGRWPMQFLNASQFTEYDIAPWPKNRAQKTVFAADGWGISTKAKQRGIAWEMIKELASAQSQQEAVGLNVAIPARRTAAESREFLAQPQHAALFYQSLLYAAPLQAPANYSEIEQIFMQSLGQIMVNQANPEDALKAADQELTAAMQRQALKSTEVSSK